jgi:DNA-binding GntR family transcriptional regulator
MGLQGSIEEGRAVSAGHFGSPATGAALFRAADLATAGRDKLTSVPLYLQVSRVIEQRIRSGALAVGSLLPVETDLAKMFGVSRQTVRHAIAHLRDRGMLSARKGIGTRVESTERDWRSSFSVASVGDLFELARETELHIATRQDIEARGKLAIELGCRPGRKWFYFAGPRYHAPNETAFCWNEVYIDGRLGSIVRKLEVFRVAVFALVQERSGEYIVEIKQEIRPAAIGAEPARYMGVSPGDLALEITRRYFASGGRLIQLSKTLLPADRFAYSMTFRPG